MNFTLTSLIQYITQIINGTTGILLAFALLGLLWGVVRGFGSIDSAEKRAEARQSLLWSLIAIVIVVTLAGIIAVVTSTFNLDVR